MTVRMEAFAYCSFIFLSVSFVSLMKEKFMYLFVRIKQMKILIGGPSSMPLLVIMTKRELTWRKDMTRSW